MQPSSSDSENEGDNKADWAETYTTLMCHTNETRESIGNMDIPFLEAIMKRLGKHVNLRMGLPFGGLLGSGSSENSDSGELSTAEEIDKFYSEF